MTFAAGQLCTKPGVVFVPRGAEGDRSRPASSRACDEADPARCSTSACAKASAARLTTSAPSLASSSHAHAGQPARVRHGVALRGRRDRRRPGRRARGCFGPAVPAWRATTARRTARRRRALRRPALGGRLRRAGAGARARRRADRGADAARRAARLRRLPDRRRRDLGDAARRPYPATTARTTVGGLTSTRRFMRPVCWQSARSGRSPRSCGTPTRMGLAARGRPADRRARAGAPGLAGRSEAPASAGGPRRRRRAPPPRDLLEEAPGGRG